MINSAFIIRMARAFLALRRALFRPFLLNRCSLYPPFASSAIATIATSNLPLLKMDQAEVLHDVFDSLAIPQSLCSENVSVSAMCRQVHQCLSVLNSIDGNLWFFRIFRICFCAFCKQLKLATQIIGKIMNVASYPHSSVTSRTYFRA